MLGWVLVLQAQRMAAIVGSGPFVWFLRPIVSGLERREGDHQALTDVGRMSWG